VVHVLVGRNSSKTMRKVVRVEGESKQIQEKSSRIRRKAWKVMQKTRKIGVKEKIHLSQIPSTSKRKEGPIRGGMTHAVIEKKKGV